MAMTPERKREYMKEWRARNQDYHRGWFKRQYGRDSSRYLVYARNGALKKKYGITVAVYEEMLTAQSGVCAICQQPPKKYRLAVDHNHLTGQVRKLLCAGCNTKLVAIEDAEFRAKADAYLKEHG